MKNKIAIMGLFITLILSGVKAQESSLTLGLGVAYLSYPEYAGSSITKNKAFPLPFIKYESDFITIDKNRISKNLFQIDNLYIDISFGGHIPVENSEDSLRHGMDDLDASLEVGPELNYELYKSDHLKLTLELPIRMVIMSDFSTISHNGYVANSNLHANIKHKKIEVDIITGLTAATKEYYQYYYEVQTKDVTSDRPTYSPHSGYGGFTNSLGVTYKDGNMWYGAFVKYHMLNNTTFESSPLVSKKYSNIHGVAISYIF